MEKVDRDRDQGSQPPLREVSNSVFSPELLKKIRWSLYALVPALVALGLVKMNDVSQQEKQISSAPQAAATPVPERKNPSERYKELLDEYFTKLRKAYADGDQEETERLLDEFAQEQKKRGLDKAVAQYELNWSDVKRTSAVRNLVALCNGTADQNSPLVQGLERVLRAYRALETAQDDVAYAKAYRELNAALESSGYTLKSIGESSWDVMAMNVALGEKEDK